MNAMGLMRLFTIRLRMLGAIGMVLFLLGLLGAGGLWGMARIQSMTDVFIHGSFAEVQHLSQLRSVLGQVRQSEKDMIIEYERPHEVEKAYGRWKGFLEQADQLSRQFLEGEDDADNPVVRDLAARLKVYAQAFEPSARQLMSSGYESATTANRLSQKAIAEALAAEELVRQVEAILQKEVDSAIQAQADAAQTTRLMFMLALVLAVLVVVPLTILNMNSICAPLEQVRQAARAMAGGDLSQRSEVQGRDEVADLQRALREMQDGLGTLVSQVRDASESVALASQEIASGNQDLSHRTEQTASSVQDTVSSLSDLTGHVQQTAGSAQMAYQWSGSASALAEQGGAVVSQAVSSMHEIAGASRKISDIIGLIDSIAFQTNILALNAAVEAARAGEQGRGFAVVASEVRSLAQRSAGAANEIKALISNSVDTVDAGVRLVEQAGRSMQEMVTGVQRVSDIIGEITASATDQSSGIAQVNQSLSHIDQMTQQNAALVEQSSAAAESLRDQADRLSSVVGQFRL